MISTKHGNTDGGRRQTVLIRSMPCDLWHEAKATALKRRMTLREFVVEALERAVSGRKR